jgi:uncharacterized protein YqfA (UPF0365 family)
MSMSIVPDFAILAQDESWSTGTMIVLGILIIIILVIVMILWRFIGLYIRAWISGASVGMLDLIGMSLRKVNQLAIVNARIQAVRAGLDVSTQDMESHVLAGGDVVRVINAMIAANKANIDIPWQTATAIDLAGRDILDAVQTSVNPKVIDVPNPALGRQTIDAVAKDGIQLRVKARVTVRTNIKSLVGGATEETIIARVGEGIVTAIGSAVDYKDVLENPDHISKAVLHKGLDANTAFEILSIDIADIDVGENVGAKLQADQAESDKRRFQAEAEKRRAIGHRPGAGKHRQGRRKPRCRRARRSRNPQGDGRCVSQRQHGHYGLLQDEERAGRHHHARVHCQADGWRKRLAIGSEL